MDDGIKGIGAEQRIEGIAVAQIGLDEGKRLAGDLLHPLQRRFLAIAQVINDDDVMARRK